MPTQVVSRPREIMEAIGSSAGFFASAFDRNAAPTPSRRFAGSIIRALQSGQFNCRSQWTSLLYMFYSYKRRADGAGTVSTASGFTREFRRAGGAPQGGQCLWSRCRSEGETPQERRGFNWEDRFIKKTTKKTLARKLLMLIITIMNSTHLPMSETARRVRKPKARKGRVRSKNDAVPPNSEPQLAAAGSLTRTKALLLAALRVWELKHRIGE
jgi:hypothetical protein